MNGLISIRNLHAVVEKDDIRKEIIKGLDMEINSGEIHLIMGPNGSGKSTLALAIMGHPNYRVSKGEMKFKGEEISKLSPDKRAQMGIFLAFQHPEEVDGVRIIDYLRLLVEKVRNIPKNESYNFVVRHARKVWFSEEDLKRYINVGFSGGERKRFEILQSILLNPKLVILDEPDSGADVDSLSLISLKLRDMQKQGKGIMLITHYGRILQHIEKREIKVHIMRDGKIVMSGGEELVDKIEKVGFAKIFEECGCNE